MKLSLLSLGAACLLVAALVLAGPALSARPSLPAAVEWESSAPHGSAGARAASVGGVLSAPVRPGRRFNLVGLRWRGAAEPEIAVRVRVVGGRWGRFTPVEAHADGGPDRGTDEPRARGVSSPLWTGEADELQYRLSRPVPGLRLHYVNTLGSATRGARVRTAAARMARRAVLAVAGLQSARGQAPQPVIVPRAAWGGDQCQPRGGAAYGEVRAAIVHHTVTANEYPPEQAAAAVLAICRYHRNANGWNDIGYNFLVDRFGTIYEGRAGGVDRPVLGAQAQGLNSQTTGIANLGGHETLPQSAVALDAIARIVRWKLPLHGQPTAGTVTVTSAGGPSSRFAAGQVVTLNRVSGHRDGNQTSCPGGALYAQLPDLRARVGSLPGLGTPAGLPVGAPAGFATPRTRIEVRVAPGVLAFGQPAQVSGRLRLVRGDAVEGATVDVQQLDRGGWRTLSSTTSTAGGTFAATVPADGRRVLRVRFPGDAQRLSSTSKQSVVSVRPTLVLGRSVARAPVGRTPTVTGRIGPAKRRVILVVERRIGGRNTRVARFVVPARQGRFRKGYRLRQPGLHRFIAVFPGDGTHLPVESMPLYVRAVTSRTGGARR